MQSRPALLVALTVSWPLTRILGGYARFSRMVKEDRNTPAIIS